MSERLVHANGVELCIGTFGSVADPAALLIAGAASSMDWWDDELCTRLATGGLYVIRYDLRDTGQSANDPPGAPTYTMDDLTDDVAGLLDALKIDAAHLVGISMGGSIAQRVAVRYPDRVASLTLLSTSSGGPGTPENGLPGMSPELRADFAAPSTTPDWSNRDEVIDHIVAGLRPLTGAVPVDDERARVLAARIYDRTRDIEAATTNHMLLADVPPVRSRLAEIHAPTLIVHGTDDPLFPLGHGEALAREIPGAELLPLEGVGHEMPPRRVWDDLVRAILGLVRERATRTS